MRTFLRGDALPGRGFSVAKVAQAWVFDSVGFASCSFALSHSGD